MPRELSSRARMLVCLAALSLLAAPVEFVVHEGAHYLAARSFGAQATLHFDRVTLHGNARLGDAQTLLFAAAGPAVDWLVGLGALALLIQRYTPLRLVLAIWAARPLQFAPALLGLELPGLGICGSLDGTDEAVVAHAIGLSPAAILWAELIAALPLFGLIVLQVPSAYRWRGLGVLAIGVLAGWAGWLILGAYVLP